MRKLTVVAFLGLLFAACSGTPESGTSEFMTNPVTGEGNAVEETPIEERIANALQEAKQQYDDGAMASAWKWAQQAEALIKEHQFPDEDLAMALTIQGYCLLQMGHIDDYYVSTHGVLDGAISKFEFALNIRADDFRCRLGIALCKFRRHGDSILKAELLADGVVMLESVREDFKRGMGKDGARLLKEANRKLEQFKSSREKLVALGYIFTDPRSVPLGDDTGVKPKWLSKLTEEASVLAVNECLWISQDAMEGIEMTREDRDLFDKHALALADSFREVRTHWRLSALTDLQASRDGLLKVREQDREIVEETGRLPYFWVDRDLTFVFESLGAFFLDSGLEAARMQAIAEGTSSDRLEPRAREIYLEVGYTTADKEKSKANYEAALSYLNSFYKQHANFEKLRMLKRDEAAPDKENSNPFLVDLVRRYQKEMDYIIEEERSVRRMMVLEAAVLSIEPLFQLVDVTEANKWANELKAINSGDPIHHFVRATAYFYTDDFETAKTEYEAFMDISSLTDDANRRSIARMRIMQCEQQLKRNGGAGE